MKFKKLLILVIAGIILVSAATTAFAKSFTDVPQSHWAYEAINTLSDQGIIDGYNNRYNPSSSITNAEFTKLVVTSYLIAEGLPALPPAAANQQWYQPVLNKAIELNIISRTQFAGKENSAIPRSEMALLMANALPKAPAVTNADAIISGFSDSANINLLDATHKAAVAKVAFAGIMTGNDNKAFNASGTATRAEAAQVIHRFLDYCSKPAALKVDTALTGSITIAAAASLTDATIDLQKIYNTYYPNVKLIFTYGSSGALQTQIEEGAPVDVFMSAAQRQMDALEQGGSLAAGTRKNLLKNSIVLIVPNNSKLSISSFSDVTDSSVKMIALGDVASVPAGQYAQEVFTALGIWDAVNAKANFGADVRQVLTWVESGNVDCGVVYSTDAAVANVKIIATAAENTHTPVVYPVAVLKDSKAQDLAKQFVNFLSAPEAAAVFESYGFITVK